MMPSARASGNEPGRLFLNVEPFVCIVKERGIIDLIKSHRRKEIPGVKIETYRIVSRVIVSCLFLGVLFNQAQADSGEDTFRTASLITDNMVLQQKSVVPLWGRGTPGTEVSLQASWGKSVVTRVKPDSTWLLDLPTPKAGGPYDLVIGHDDTTRVIANVLLGEVWLCSGQSNMEMPLTGWPPGDTILNAAQEIAHANIPGIRMFTVRRSFSAVPEPFCDGAWLECTSATVPVFSATAYFFGKKLHEVLGVPIGLIHASWGGTGVESWIGARYLSQVQQYDTTLQKLRECADGQRRMLDWLLQYPVIDMRQRKGESRWTELDLRDGTCASRTFGDSLWHTMGLPVIWEKTGLGNFDGVVWFRRHVTIPVKWLHRDLILNLGPIDDIDITYVNGARIGAHEGEGFWKVDRSYRIPGNLVDSTLLTVAVRVIDYQGGGGIFGPPASLNLHPDTSDTLVSLAGDWKYLPVARYLGNSLYVFGVEGNLYDLRPRLPVELSANSPTTLYNGMISPLIPYAIRGVAWYQGESNTERPKMYRQLFPLLIENWRSDFKVGSFPFYYVQIAPFEYDAPTQSQFLREAQVAALAVKNTGMAVTLDIGNPANIHPANKQDVGARLAFWALSRTYKKKVAYSGPLYASVKKRKGALEIFFTHAEKGLVIRGGEQGNGFQIAGADRVFRDALVRVRGSSLILSHPDIPSPQAVRYAFSNAPKATLFSKDGLPASSFRTDNWE
jgi:sialate O-acetylesterase